MRSGVLALAASLALFGCGGGGGDGGGGGGGNPPPGQTTLNFSTYLGDDQHDFVRDVVVDSSGNVYAVGGAESADLPTTAGTFQPNFGGLEDAFVAKFNPQGGLVWSTFLGGQELDRAYAVELDHQGNVIVAGRAGAHFPVTQGTIQPTFQGGPTQAPIYPNPQDGFVAKINGANGARMWATFFGAVDAHPFIVRDVAVDRSNGTIYLAASTETGNYTQAVLDAFGRGTRPNRIGGIDGVIAKLSNDGATLDWANYVGGSADESAQPSVRVDSQGNPIILFATRSSNAPTTAGAFERTLQGGEDYYLAKFALDGSLVWATFVGGPGDESSETHNLAIRADNALVIAGRSSDDGFPTHTGAYDRTHNSVGDGDCAIAVISANGASLLAGSYYGGSAGELCEGVGVDGNGNVYVTGGTSSSGLPTTTGAFQNNLPASRSPFIAVFNRDLTALRFGSYFAGGGGGIGRDLAVHGEAHFVFGGEMGAGYPLKSAVRSNVTSGVAHGGVTDITVVLGPG